MPICPNRKFTVDPNACILLALMVLVVPVRWILAWLLAITVHELSHCIALRLCRVRIYSINIGLFGAKIETEQMSAGVETLCAAAGPLGGTLLVFFLRQFPVVAICAAFQSAYNLLPILPLDGGRIIWCLLCLLKNERVSRLCRRIVEWGVFAILFFASLLALHQHFGPIPLLCTISLFLKNRQIKFPCKRAEQIVQ